MTSWALYVVVYVLVKHLVFLYISFVFIRAYVCKEGLVGRVKK